MRALTFSLVISLLARGTGSGADRYPDPDWPQTKNWKEAATSSERIDAYAAWLREHAGLLWTSVVIKNGYLIYEGRGPRCHVRQKNDCGSILKPLQGTALGAALYQGKLKSLDVDAMPYWKNPFVTPFENDRAITFRQFAQYHDRWNEEPPPGTFHYNNAGATAAGACIAGLFREVSGPRAKGIAEVVRKEVADKIRADWNLWYWEEDFIPGRSGESGPQFAFESDGYELAKLGYLWLRRGRWMNTRIFSEDFYREGTTDWSPNTGDTRSGFVGHYGYWWFVNDKRILMPDVPEDAFWAIGNGMPKRASNLMIIPSLDIVAVLSMERISDDKKWDVIQNSRLPSNDGPKLWGAEVAKLHVKP